MSSVHEKSGEQAALAFLSKGKRSKRQRSVSPLEAREEEVAVGGEVEFRDFTDQDKQMVNCLMLLSRGETEESEEKQADSSGLELEGLYQCQTCDKTFPSFQALGGHRSVHKKLKLGESDFKFASSVETVEAADAGRDLHECWICNAVLPSGQSLGGHMRKHRGFNPMATSSFSSSVEESVRPKNNLMLDLNLPAAPEDDPQGGWENKH